MVPRDFRGRRFGVTCLCCADSLIATVKIVDNFNFCKLPLVATALRPHANDTAGRTINIPAQAIALNTLLEYHPPENILFLNYYRSMVIQRSSHCIDR